MRCPDCSKFVSYDDPEVEVDSEDTDEETQASAEITVRLNCAECGTTLKETSLTAEVTFEDHECQLEDDKKGEDKPGTVEPSPTPEIEIESVEAEGSSRTQTVDRHGKPIKNFRYAKTYYGADVTFHLHCKTCDETFDLTTEVEEQASAFDEVC